MTKNKLFHRDFTMVVIGQIISLFGNAVLRYALPLYLLNQTHSAALFGAVSACAFLPMIFFSPFGGIVADRVNKRSIMVILDFFTAAIVLAYSLLRGALPLVPLLIAVLMLLYGIQGAYQPAVSASLPVLASPENLNAANAAINMVSSLSGLLGPALGGVIFAAFGLPPILYISAFCFFCSAVMEIFIRIPFLRPQTSGGVWQTIQGDLRDSFRFITKQAPVLGKLGLIAAAINGVFSALIMVGMPVVITESLGFSQAQGNRLYGFAQGALALGGLLGGLLVGVLGSRLKFSNSYRLLLPCTATLLPILLAVAFTGLPLLSYGILVLSCFVMMVLSSMFSIEVMAYAQTVTPQNLIGKVIAFISCLVLCANPLGQLIYGVLFELLGRGVWPIFGGAFLLCLPLLFFSKKVIQQSAK